MMARSQLLVVLAVGILLLEACGEKITVPVAEGVPSSSEYVEKVPWDLDDPVDAIEAAGLLFVLEGAPGTITKYKTSQDTVVQQGGLVDPTALAVEIDRAWVLVAENGPPPAISLYDQRDLSFFGRFSLEGIAQSAAGIAADDQWVYVSDPDSGAVHRLRWVSEAEGWLQPQGLVCSNTGSMESPQFVFQPAGLALEEFGNLLICDADTTRNWVLRFDPEPPAEDPEGPGRAIVFREIACPTPPLEGFVLGRAPGCGEEFIPGPTDEPGGLHSPVGITLDTTGRYYVADRDNGRVQRYGPSGVVDLIIGLGNAGVGGLQQPLRITTWYWEGTTQSGVRIVIDAARIFVVDRGTSQIRIFEDRNYTTFQSGT